MMFYKETNFKETPIGMIPKDWDVAKLGDDLIEIETGKRAKGGALSKGIVASIGGEHVDNQGNVLWNDMKFIPEDFYKFLKQGKVKQGDILLVKDGATTGKVAIVRKLEYEKVAINEHVFVIRSKADSLVDEFLFYFLFSKFGQVQIKTRFHGMIGGIIRDDLRTVLIPIPPTYEQRKIAEIFSVVDLAIQKTDEAMAETECLKKGLMQKLLTKGIGHKEFKQTEIGIIPKTWQITKLGDIAIKVQNGLYKEKEFYGEGHGIIRMTEFFKDDVLTIGEDILRVHVKDEELDRFSLEEGDLLFARRSLKAEGSGKCVIVSKVPAPTVFESSIIRIKLDDTLAFPKFYFYWLNSPIGRTYVNRIIRTVAVSGVTGSDLKSLKVPLPPKIDEQRKIADIISLTDDKLKLEKNEKVRLEHIKQGLMNLFLIGKVRVKVA